MEAFDVNLPTLQATNRLGECIGRVALPGDALLLIGELGTGKTTLTQAIARSLGILDKVVSPTFTLVNEYREHASDSPKKFPLFHFDLYRLEAAQTDELGLWEYWEGNRGLVVIEWAERLLDQPDDFLEVKLFHAGEERRARLISHGERSFSWLKEIVSCWS
ncbi:MAG TPA: tRNA (adenosine(37)-N6)-threonylcarbamoyltransferase complex ATPase subunit type 1 TsaE [Chroococcales cyanobacterium]|jgi:tRNA threonylcarbamoyladenosine biosynthesis protein TsaE